MHNKNEVGNCSEQPDFWPFAFQPYENNATIIVISAAGVQRREDYCVNKMNQGLLVLVFAMMVQAILGLNCNDDAWVDGSKPLFTKDSCLSSEKSCYYLVCKMPNGDGK
jgi:hypothetical protein